MIQKFAGLMVLGIAIGLTISQAATAQQESFSCCAAKKPQFATDGAAAAKTKGWVTIAVIGAEPKRIADDVPADQAVEGMIAHWRGQLQQVLPDRPDLIVLPEYCDTPAGRSDANLAEYYQARGDRVRDFFAEFAKQNHCYIAYPSLRISADGARHNSVTLFDRQGGVVGIYDKNYPSPDELADKIVPGTQAGIFECDFGRVACATCFDLNFDSLRERCAAARPDVIIFPSFYHGGLMQGYWAYSCRAYFAGACARASIPSEIRLPTGDVIASNTNYRNFAVARVNLDYAMVHLDGHKDKLAALKAKYGPQVSIADPGRLGSVLVSSDHPTISVSQMLTEFEITPLDAYFQNALSQRDAAIKSLSATH